MVTALVVDDSSIDRRLAGSLLAKAGVTCSFAENGAEALLLLATALPDVVVTDLQMPELDGLALVTAVRARFPSLPVILMTAHGSEEIAVKALQSGAASYVPKRELARKLARTVFDVLSVSPDGAVPASGPGPVRERHFELSHDLARVPVVVAELEEGLARARLCDETGRIQVAVALREAIVNAMLHGSLELPSALLETDPAAHAALAAERRVTPPYAERRVKVRAIEAVDEATYDIIDEGPGFDVSTCPDPLAAGNVDKSSGRGLFLIRTFMDEVRQIGRAHV